MKLKECCFIWDRAWRNMPSLSVDNVLFLSCFQRWTAGACVFVQFMPVNLRPLPCPWEKLPNPHKKPDATAPFSYEMAERSYCNYSVIQWSDMSMPRILRLHCLSTSSSLAQLVFLLSHREIGRGRSNGNEQSATLFWLEAVLNPAPEAGIKHCSFNESLQQCLLFLKTHAAEDLW